LLQQAMKKAPVMPSAAKHLLFLAENKQKAHPSLRFLQMTPSESSS